MKCRECSCCHKGYWTSSPDVYVCIGVKEPFEIYDINQECSEYKEKHNTTEPDLCPFCGKKPKIYRSTFSERYRVRCEDGCGAETAPFSTKEKAVMAWNRRMK